ncbi:MAG: polyprenyl synthetase family protein, partial [Acidimicrobiia bacterium]|nr:polyprenyl synthetase family protein [Acidimicrobiia bacterium]
ATRIGGIVAGRERSVIDGLTEFGRLYGMAFQVIDDILDVIATDEQLGKPAGKDMLEGVYSLPVIHTLSSPVGMKLRELLLDGLAESDRHLAIDLVRQGPGIDSALTVAAGFVDRARSEILAVADNRAANALADTAQHLLDSVTATRPA